MKQAASSWTTRHYNPEDRTLHNEHSENLNSYLNWFVIYLWKLSIFTRIGGWGMHQSYVLWLGRKSRREEARKHRIYSGAKCSTVKCWFSVNAICFVKCFAFNSVINSSEECYSWQTEDNSPGYMTVWDLKWEYIFPYLTWQFFRRVHSILELKSIIVFQAI
jgi:hypothetical protein